MNCSQMITFLYSLFCLFVCLFLVLLFVNGNKQLGLLFICRLFCVVLKTFPNLVETSA